MKSVSSLLFAFGLLIAFELGMASQVEAQPLGWSQKLPAAIRFRLVLGNAAVLDLETNLVWEQSPRTSTRTWLDAQVDCNRRTVGDRKGWRLPTIQELASLVDPTTQSLPALPAGHPFSNVQSAGYWSATTYANDPADAWFVSLDDGGVYFHGHKTGVGFLWCVRGGQGVDPQ